MKKETIYSLTAPYRSDMHIDAYTFGGSKKAACIVGAVRGNEIQQLYVCSQLIKVLRQLEIDGAIVGDNRITVIPLLNSYSMNIGERYWAADGSDINRSFPGDLAAGATERIAGSVFERLTGYSYGIQFTSFYMSGDFIPHVRMMDTGHQSPSLANLFGLEYVIIRKPDTLDKKTLNYNWQMSGTAAFSVYTAATERIDENSAERAVSSVLRFMSRMGIIKYNCHSGYIASVIRESDMQSIRSKEAGIYRRLKKPGDSVERGGIIGEIIHPYEGYVIEQIKAPIHGVVFFERSAPVVMENDLICRIIKRFYK